MNRTMYYVIGVIALIFIVKYFISNEAHVTSMNSQSQTQTSTTITELKVTDEVVGTGATAEKGDTVTMDYVGTLTNGTVFDASKNHGSTGFTFTLGVGQVIAGWDKGIVGMKVGGKRRLEIPANLAYGNQAIGNVIPVNSALIFEVELLSIKGK